MTRPVVIITGLSGAGRASILNMLEDLSFETVDNPPLAVLEALLGDGDLPIAVGVDTRSRGFDPQALLKTLERLRLRPDLAPTLLFATAEDAVLLRRYTETRRRHPLAPGGPFGTRVQDGIARETLLMAPLREAADLLVDTTDVPLPELRRRMEARFRPEGAPGLSITVLSFGFPKGLPREADLVFDMRFLRNPHYVPALKPLTGRDSGVAEYVAEDPAFPGFWQNLTALLDPLLPRYVAEGKKYLTIAVGCTGGRHRSVFVAEKLAAHLAETSSMHGWRVELAHRELPEVARGSNTPLAENGPPAVPPDISPRDTHMTTVE
jgi:UPF0042 nucleotide-binding protein